MAHNKKSFVLYSDMMSMVEKLPPDKAGLLFLHILKYVNDLNPVSDDVLVDIAFEPIKMQLKRDLSKWETKKEKQSEGGKLGMEKRWGKHKLDTENDNIVISKLTEDISPITVNDNVSVNVNDSVNASVNDTVTVNTINLDNAEINSAVIDENILIEDVIETETFSFEKPKTEKKEKKGSAEKKESPFMNECKELFLNYYKNNKQTYLWSPIDNKGLGGIIAKIKILLNEKYEGNVPAEEIKKTIVFLLEKLPEWYKTNANSVMTINSKFNEIINQIKNERTKKQPISASVADIMSKYHRKQG